MMWKSSTARSSTVVLILLVTTHHHLLTTAAAAWMVPPRHAVSKAVLLSPHQQRRQPHHPSSSSFSFLLPSSLSSPPPRRRSSTYLNSASQPIDDDPLSDAYDTYQPPKSSTSSDSSTSLTPEQQTEIGLNELQTLLRHAVTIQDFDEAARLRDILATKVSSGAYKPKNKIEDEDEEDERKTYRLTWRGLGTAPWLVERLDALQYVFPTTIQINSFEAVNTMLGAFVDEDEDETLEERMVRVLGRREGDESLGVVISGSTGSGKTLAFLVPMLSTLSETLFTRQRIRVKAEEDVGDVTEDILSRVAVATSPALRGRPGNRQIGGKKGMGALELGASLSTLGKSGTDVRSPVSLIVVPTRELGVQIALLLYELVGGNVKKTGREIVGLANMFKYKGPKGVRIGCVLDPNEASQGLKLQTDVAITTPQFLGKLMRDGDVDPSKLRVVVYDEADLTLERTSDEDLKMLFQENMDEREFSRLTYLVGASVTERLGSLAVRDSVLPEGKSFIATATRFAPLEPLDPEVKGMSWFNKKKKKKTKSPDDEKTNKDSAARSASLKDLNLCLDPGLKHERVVAPNDTGLLTLARMLRKELRNYEDAIADAGEGMANATTTTSTDIQRPRVVVFFPDEQQARNAISALRDAMWGEHRLCVLLPDTGANPLKMMEDFKAGDTSVMLATPNSVRGLDFPALTHVYTLYLPMDDPREYLHLAGRVGRIGQSGSVQGRGGRVVSILRPEEAEQMGDLANELDFEFVDVDAKSVSDGGEVVDVENGNVEDMRRYLEDTMTLLELTEEPEVDMDQVLEREKAGYLDDEEEDDDDEENMEEDDDDDDIPIDADGRCDI